MRNFELILPRPPMSRPGLSEDPPASLQIETDPGLYVPKSLERTGLADYEPATLALFLALMEERSGGHLFDIGSNVGVFALLAAALTDWNVTAFEPEPTLAAVARQLARDNGLEFAMEEIALGRSNGTATLYLSSVTDSSNSLREGFRPAAGTVEVPLSTLDRYVVETGRVPDLLKIDTETTEPDVIEGARQTLEAHRPWILCEVLAGRTEDELNRLLPRHGYHIYHVTADLPLEPVDEIVGDRTHEFNNWLFAPEIPSGSLWEATGRWRQSLAACQPWGRADGERRVLERPALRWEDPGNPGVLGERWRPRRTEPRCLAMVEPSGGLRVQSTLGGDERFYLSHGQTPFDRPPADASDWKIEPGVTYQLAVDLEVIEGKPGVQLWAIRYDDERLGHTNQSLRPGPNFLAFRTEERAETLRLALRFSGSGVVRLSPVRLVEIR